jgi:hypothetical protein
MKRILAFALLALSAAAHAELTLVATAGNVAGGTIGLYRGVDECATGVGVLLKLPFTEGIPGCVTSLAADGTAHVYFNTGLEMDYPKAIWTRAPGIKPLKGAM